MTRPEYISPFKRWPLVGDALYWLLLVAGCAVFLLMNMYTTLKEDDYFHMFIQGSGEPIKNLADVVRAWIAYMRFDTRTANLTDFLFNGILGKTAFNVCNTLVLGVMGHLLSRLTTGRNSVMALVMLFTFIVAAMPVPGETLLWVAGSCNYLWAMTASLLFVAYLLWHRDTRLAWWKAVLVVALSLLAGGSNEGTTFGMFGGLVIYYLFNRDKVDRAVVLAMTGYLLGVVLLVSCPGAWDRASSEVSHDAGFMHLLADRARIMLELSRRYVVPLAALAVLLVSLVARGPGKTMNTTPWPWIFLVACAFAFVVGKPQERLYFSMTFVALIIIVMAVHALFRRLWWPRAAIVVAGLAICCVKYPSNLATLQRYQAFVAQVDDEIARTPDRQVILKRRHFDGYSRFIKLLNLDSWNFYIRNESMCRHYGKDNIQFVDDSLHARYHEGLLLDGAEAVPFTCTVDDIEAVYTVPGADYMAVKMRQDSVSYSYQFADVVLADGTAALPVPYFPVLYQGREYLIFKQPDEKAARLRFAPFEYEGETIDLHLNRAGSGADR